MSQFEIIIKIVSRQKTGQKMRLTSICFKEEKVMKKKLAMVLTGVAVCGLLMVACQGKDKGAVTDDVQTEGVEPVEQATPEAAEPTPEAAEPEETPEAEETGNETAPEAGEAEGAGESEGEDAEDSADAKPEAGAEGEDGSADVNAAENEEPQEEADTETKAN